MVKGAGKVKLKLILVIIVVLLLSDLAWAQEKLEFEFWQDEYSLNKLIKTKFDARELKGKLALDFDLSMELSYQFWDQSRLDKNKLENFSLKTVKDFAPQDSTKFALGIGLDYYQLTVKSEKLSLSQLEGKTLELVLALEKDIMERVNLFTELEYGLYNDHQFFNHNLASELTYNSDYNYSLKAGLDFKLGPNLRTKVGYKFSRESLQRAKRGETIVNNYNLTHLLQQQQGLFLGLETIF